MNVEPTVFENTLQSLDLFEEKHSDEFLVELQCLINRYSRENGSNTPDFILATYLMGCLENFNKTLQYREKWYGRG